MLQHIIVLSSDRAPLSPHRVHRFKSLSPHKVHIANGTPYCECAPPHTRSTSQMGYHDPSGVQVAIPAQGPSTSQMGQHIASGGLPSQGPFANGTASCEWGSSRNPCTRSTLQMGRHIASGVQVAIRAQGPHQFKSLSTHKVHITNGTPYCERGASPTRSASQMGHHIVSGSQDATCHHIMRRGQPSER